MKKANSKRLGALQRVKRGGRIVSLSDGTKVRKYSRAVTSQAYLGRYRVISAKQVESLLRKRDEVLYNTEREELNSMSRFIKDTFED